MSSPARRNRKKRTKSPSKKSGKSKNLPLSGLEKQFLSAFLPSMMNMLVEEGVKLGEECHTFITNELEDHFNSSDDSDSDLDSHASTNVGGEGGRDGNDDVGGGNGGNDDGNFILENPEGMIKITESEGSSSSDEFEDEDASSDDTDSDDSDLSLESIQSEKTFFKKIWKKYGLDKDKEISKEIKSFRTKDAEEIRAGLIDLEAFFKIAKLQKGQSGKDKSSPKGEKVDDDSSDKGEEMNSKEEKGEKQDEEVKSKNKKSSSSSSSSNNKKSPTFDSPQANRLQSFAGRMIPDAIKSILDSQFAPYVRNRVREALNDNLYDTDSSEDSDDVRENQVWEGADSDSEFCELENEGNVEIIENDEINNIQPSEKVPPDQNLDFGTDIINSIQQYSTQISLYENKIKKGEKLSAEENKNFKELKKKIESEEKALINGDSKEGSDAGDSMIRSLEEWKMVILARTDLNLSPGKLSAQCSHATHRCIKKASKKQLSRWENDRNCSTKIVLGVNSLEELKEIRKRARELKLTTGMIEDAGRTEIEPGTITCLGIGPGLAQEIDICSRHLKPYPDSLKEMKKKLDKALVREEQLKMQLEKMKKMGKKEEKETKAGKGKGKTTNSYTLIEKGGGDTYESMKKCWQLH